MIGSLITVLAGLSVHTLGTALLIGIAVLLREDAFQKFSRPDLTFVVSMILSTLLYAAGLALVFSGGRMMG